MPDERADQGHVQFQPGAPELALLRSALAPFRQLTRPVMHGIENIPASGAVLVVGNHGLLALDMPFMIDEIHRGTGRFVRGAADNAHYAIPGWRDILTRYGAVHGTRDNCRALLAAGEAVLLYPGGGREVAKRKNEHYKLIWKERLGFVRLAVEAGCPIVPFGAVGADDFYDIVVDADHPALSPLRSLVERFGGRWDIVFPLVRGIGPTPVPRPQRLYFSFGEPVTTSQWAGRQDDTDLLRSVRDQVKSAVQRQIDLMLDEREQAQRKR
ncbi:lysophospholipid acyltransferase family protein [Hoyosella altamirensis]|uniref:1-acyl-sn-glycerol-3-phosphate acyltransferase n=1 Tax=Hoyosella altamirensis TaxID=616997 RepID=A0A839RKE5_9ACTN|nr:lysophospholipid acyltransferase family protein [Hoyosella altamirensis]MBB3036867.1 1-acyl-sn-glycerol-3-phosphate acyltransferase [Hoyosella altamirensis]